MTNKNSNLLVIDGGTVKTDEDGIVTGLGIVFGSENQPDQSRERDFFTAESFIMKKSAFTVPLFYNHAVGPINDQIGEATLTKTHDGWQATATIDTSDEIGQKVYEAVKDKPHGFSTGALQHLVKRESKANNTNFLKQWVVGELSLTERPAERRAVVQSVKSSTDGEAVYEDAWPIETADSTTITFFDKDGAQLWDASEDIKSLEPLLKQAKSLTIKEVGGSVSYSVYIYDDDNPERMASISVYEYGGVQDFIGHLQDVISVAAAAVAADDAEDAAESGVLDAIGIGKSKDLDKRIQDIVKTMLEKDQVKVSELKIQLEEKEAELGTLKETLVASENALADLKREQFVEILTGADDTINKNKGK